MRLLQWLKSLGRCKVCGKVRKLDCCKFCNACYPYDDSCDMYKRVFEGGDYND